MKNRKNNPKPKNPKTSRDMPKLAISLRPEVSNPLGSVVSNMFCKGKSAHKKKFRGDFRPLANKNVQMLDHFFPLLFPKDSESLKILDIWLREVGAKRTLNGTSKVNTQTHTHIDKSTYWKHRPRGPMLWKLSHDYLIACPWSVVGRESGFLKTTW